MINIISPYGPVHRMNFDNDKKVVLSKADKSKKGDWDEMIIPLCDLINKDDRFFTTSSCAGRIVLMSHSGSGKKIHAEWILKSHEPVAFNALRDSLHNYSGKDDLWIRAEGMIIHVRCRTLEDAKLLLDCARTIGLKRSGIISIGTKFVVEALSVDKLETIVSQGGTNLVDDVYLGLLLDEANKKLLRTHDRILQFMAAVSHI